MKHRLRKYRAPRLGVFDLSAPSGAVAVRHRRHAIGFDVNGNFVDIATKSAGKQSRSMF